MNNEESRLRTFSMWPSDAAVDSSRIAKAGFFYTGQGLEVQCFACGGKITEWNYGDQVMAKHRRLDPHCPFVINPSSSGNVPKLNTSSLVSSTHLPPSTSPTSSAQSRNDNLVYGTELARLESFIEWPVSDIVTPQSLAKAGFYSLQIEDKVKCVYCDGVVGYWVRGDDPKMEHRRHFPQCAFVLADFDQEQLDNNSQNSNQITNSKLVNSDNFQELGIQAHKGPRQPRYATLESRLRTFGNWSDDLIQTPEMLAEAGFYYVGTGDQVRCFHCDGGLRNWDPEDDPWIEHARWFPTCAFLRLIKGQEFILSCNPQELAHNILTNDSRHETNGRTSNRREISDQDIQIYLHTAPALTALSIGLPLGRVKQAIRQKLQDTGSSYTSPDALIEAALNLQLEDFDDPSELDTEISNQVTSILSSVVQQSKDETKPAQMSVQGKTNEDNFTESLSAKLSLEEENRQLKEARLCKICMDNEIGVVFLPCGHLTTCVNCAPSLSDCPVCRSVIKGTVRTFLS